MPAQGLDFFRRNLAPRLVAHAAAQLVELWIEVFAVDGGFVDQTHVHLGAAIVDDVGNLQPQLGQMRAADIDVSFELTIEGRLDPLGRCFIAEIFFDRFHQAGLDVFEDLLAKSLRVHAVVGQGDGRRVEAEGEQVLTAAIDLDLSLRWQRKPQTAERLDEDG